MDKVRIAKYLAAQNVCSRREAERHIAEGHITLNGARVTTPVTFVECYDIVTFCGRKIVENQQNPHLWLYYKPVGEVTTQNDPQGRPTVFQTARRQGLPRVISVGRLDLNSEGLLLLTDSAALATALERPSTLYKRVYRVRLFGPSPTERFRHLARPLSEKDLAFELSSLTIHGIHYAPFTMVFKKSPHLSSTETKRTQDPHNFWVTITLTEGKNREIRKIMESFGWQVNRLIRLSYGPFELGELKPGQVRRVLPPETILKQMRKSEG